MNRKLWLLLSGVVLVGIAVIVIVKVAGGSSADPARRNIASLVQAESPRRDSVFYQLKFTGDVVPVSQATIVSKVGGSLERVAVNIGSRVSENQLLALIDTTELSQQAMQTGATYENARVNFERTKELAEQNLLAKQELDNAKAAMKIAQANYETARTRLRFAHITAPFAGYITKRYLDPGAVVTASTTPLFALMDLDAMKIVINVLEKDIPLISVGKEAVITVDAFPGRQFRGTVTRVSQAVDLSTRTMAIEIDIPNPAHLLKPGMFAGVTLIVDIHPKAITVPTQALLKDDQGSYVYVFDGSAARRRGVTPGIEQKTRTEILAGLDGSERVITTGQNFVKDGSQVTLQR
jgi:membrane fusion protein (multidrug efflux system)